MKAFALFLCYLLVVLSATARADIYRGDNGQLIKGTEGITPGPGVVLGHHELAFAALSERDLTGARFDFSNLTSAWLYSSTLTDANLAGANLTDANLDLSTLTNADLTAAVVTGVESMGQPVQPIPFEDFRRVTEQPLRF